jgi:diguanylate cyclase (GGDEF)-like protein/PAS domain S-box-containing protein
MGMSGILSHYGPAILLLGAAAVLLFLFLFLKHCARRRARRQEQSSPLGSRERFRLLVESALDGINICELDTRNRTRHLVFCNDRFVEMSGYSREELMACPDLNQLVTDMSDRQSGQGSLFDPPTGQPLFGMASWKRPDGKENVHEWSVACYEKDGRHFVFGFDRDVAERQQARRALQDSEQRYRSTIEAIGDAICVIDRDYRILLENQAFKEHRRSSGSTGNAIGRDLFQVMTFLPPSVREQYEKVFRDGKVLVTEPTFDIGGRQTTFDVRKVPIFEGGQVARVLAVVRDVTERRLTEAALEKSEREKAAVLNAMSEALIFYDTEMRVLWANRAAGEAAGCQPAALAGKTCHQMWFAREEACPECPLAGALTEGRPQEAEVISAQGDRWWHVHRHPVHDSEGVLQGFVDVALDITARKRNEQNLAQWAAVAESTDDAMIATMLDGTITRWNPGAARIYGYSAAEIVGSCVLTLAPQERRPDLRRAFSGVARGERVQQYETANLTRQGVLINVAFTMSPMFDQTGQVTGICVIARDITENVRLREELLNLSLVDALTGLNNRRGFFHLATQQFKVARRTQHAALLIFADVDNMKWINDSLGHKAGDRALIDTAEALRNTFREADIIGRIGGDEFAVLAIEAQTVSAAEILARLEGHLAERNARDGHHFQLSLSVGLVDCRPDEPISFDDMLAEADARMYDHKRSKKTVRSHSLEQI